MTDIGKLTREERIFLSGCIKALVMSDGGISKTELLDIDTLYKKEGFDDFDDCLEKFEEKVEDAESFWTEAKKVKSGNARSVIISHLGEIARDGSLPDASKSKLLNDLKANWGIK